MAGKTQQQYYDEDLAKRSAATEKDYATRQANTEQSVADEHAIIDASTQSTTQKYQQQIDAAPGTYHANFAKNELNEALGRQRAELKMANMGMMDSGLSETSQAALSVQRANANATDRRKMQEFVQKFEAAILEVETAAENEKKQIAINAKREDDEWYAARQQADRDNASTYAAAMYAADQEVEAARIEAQQKATAEALDRQHEVNMKLLDEGYSYEDVYGSVEGATDEDTRVKINREAANELLKGFYNYPSTKGNFWVNRIMTNYDEARWFAEKTLENLQKEAWFTSADAETKNYALAIATGRALWQNSSNSYNDVAGISNDSGQKMTHKEAYVRGLSSIFGGIYLELALESAGIFTEKELKGADGETKSYTETAQNNKWIRETNKDDDRVSFAK